MGILLGGDGDLGAVSGVRVLLGWFSCFEGGRVVGVAVGGRVWVVVGGRVGVVVGIFMF